LGNGTGDDQYRGMMRRRGERVIQRGERKVKPGEFIKSINRESVSDGNRKRRPTPYGI
jgi:hypothetical protein